MFRVVLALPLRLRFQGSLCYGLVKNESILTGGSGKTGSAESRGCSLDAEEIGSNHFGQKFRADVYDIDSPWMLKDGRWRRRNAVGPRLRCRYRLRL
jgi:hypothetical protein